jgi:hypothetical protein
VSQPLRFSYAVGDQNLSSNLKVMALDEHRSNYDRSPSNLRLMVKFLLAILAYVSASS